MRALAGKLIAAALAVLLLASGRSEGQFPVPTSGVGFRNDLNVPLIVQGWSLVNNMPRRGQPLLIQPGKTVWDNNVPAGVRYYCVHDANQPSRILLRDRPVPVKNADLFFGIRPIPNNPTRVVLQQEPVPPQ